MFRHLVVEITSRNFPDFILRAHDDGKLFGVMLFSPGSVAYERGEETGEAVGLVRAG